MSLCSSASSLCLSVPLICPRLCGLSPSLWTVTVRGLRESFHPWASFFSVRLSLSLCLSLSLYVSDSLIFYFLVSQSVSFPSFLPLPSPPSLGLPQQSPKSSISAEGSGNSQASAPSLEYKPPSWNLEWQAQPSTHPPSPSPGALGLPWLAPTHPSGGFPSGAPPGPHKQKAGESRWRNPPYREGTVLAKAEETQISRSLSPGGGGVRGGAEQARKLGPKRGSDHILRHGQHWESPGLLQKPSGAGLAE